MLEHSNQCMRNEFQNNNDSDKLKDQYLLDVKNAIYRRQTQQHIDLPENLQFLEKSWDENLKAYETTCQRKF